MTMEPSERSKLSELVRACRTVLRLYDRRYRTRPIDLVFRAATAQLLERVEEMLDHWAEEVITDGPESNQN